MRTRKLIGLFAIALVTSMLAGIHTAASAQPESEKPLELLTTKLPNMMPGQRGWVALNWTASTHELHDFSARLSGPAGFQITNPENRGKDSSLWADDALSVGEQDFTAFKIRVPESAKPKNVPMLVRVDYTYEVPACSDGDDDDGGDDDVDDGDDDGDDNGTCDPVTAEEVETIAASQSFFVTLPVTKGNATPFQQVTTSVGPIVAGARRWVQVDYLGVATSFAFKMSVTDAGGAQIDYPGDGTHSSLNVDDELEIGESDYAAMRIDTAGMAPGTYKLKLSASGRVSGVTTTAPSTLTLEVVAPE